MTNITVNNTSNTSNNLVISRVDEEQSTITTNIIISDENTNTISIVNVEQGPQGDKGETGAQGPPGQNANEFDVLPISSGGTNNTTYSSGNIIFYDGTKLSTSAYSVQDVLDEAALASNAVTGVLVGSGLSKTDGDNNVTIDLELGEGLEISSSNEIKVDNTIARVAELDLGEIQGQVPISKGGTNNTVYTQNRLVYYDGTKIKSFPMNTGNFLFSGISIDIIAGSGMVGGGSLQIPDGSVVIDIPSSADILVTDNDISLTTTGTAGTYSKVTTDDKGRVVSGTSLTATDIINILGYTPFHPGNDGAGSNLDADLLDGQEGYYYRDAVNLTGVLNTDILPSAVVPGNYTKIGVDSNGLVSGVFYADQADIISSLGYTPVPSTGSKIINGTTTLDGDVNINNGELSIYDNLPLLATNSPSVLPDTPRGISFVYGGIFSNKTGILAYYPANDELKLVTNVFSSGADIDGDGDSDYQDDINGGDAETLYVLQNLDGDASTILLRHIADSIYVKTKGDEEIEGLKTFVDNITFRKKIRIDDPAGNTEPPLDVSSNTGLVTNLNADLLDGTHATELRDASQITGAFSYENVTFDHIQGTNTYIPKFNDSVNDPAGKIDDSIIYQNPNSDIILDDNQSLIIGSGNTLDAEASLTVGRNNKTTAQNNLIVGTNNSVSGNNSIAFGSNSSVGDGITNSIALGDYGQSYVSKQISQGVFKTFDTTNANSGLEHGQHTTISMHAPGQQAHDWISLEPTITIPRNKTFAYNLELMITKAFGTGVAHYKFESGIFKNATFRDSSNLVNIINLTTQPQLAKKSETFNNSQFKKHYHTFEHTNGQRQLQDAVVAEGDIQSNPLSAENVETYYLYQKNPKSVSGTYYKTNDGKTILDISKPVYSGNCETDTSYEGIKIVSKNHGVKQNSLVDLKFTSATGYAFVDKTYQVYSAVGNDIFFLQRPLYTGLANYREGEPLDYLDIVIDSNSINSLDAFDGTGYASGLFDAATTIYTESSLDGSQYYDTSFEIHHNYNDYTGTPSILVSGVRIPKRSSYPSGQPIQVLGLFENSGTVSISHKDNISASFVVNHTQFNKYRCAYTKQNNILNIYHENLDRPVKFPYTPVRYELVSGYLDDDNDIFEIINTNDVYTLKTKYRLDYETKNIYKIRIRASNNVSNDFYEKAFTITVNDLRSPYSISSIPDQTTDISETYSYTVPSDAFNVEDNEGSLTFSSTLQDGGALPSWLSFNTSSLVFTGNPDGCDIGTYNIRVKAENNYSGIVQDFYLTVTDEAYQSLEYFNTNNPLITNISLANNIDENLPSGSTVSVLSCIGSYNPYFEFVSANNSCTGIFSKDSDIVECLDITTTFPTTTLSGIASLIPINADVTVNSSPASYLDDDLVAINVYAPFRMSGTIGLSDGKVYFTDAYKNYDNTFFAGMTVNTADNGALPRELTLLGYSDYYADFGGKEYLSVESGYFPDHINTEDGDEILTRDHPLTSLGLIAETVDTETTGIYTQSDERIIVADQLDFNVTWASGYPECSDRDLIENVLVSYTERSLGDLSTLELTVLENFNPPSTGDLKRSNVKYGRDTWAFRDSIQNPVIAAYGLGSGDFCNIKTESDDPLTGENSDNLISTNLNHHGSRIELERSYEIFDAYRAVKDNGRLRGNGFDNLICENDEALVHDYAIAARDADVCILFPGTRQGDIKFIYEDSIDLADTTHDYYYNWGKLIPSTFYSTKSFIRLNDVYTGTDGLKGKITYTETLTDDTLAISGLKTDTFTLTASTGCTLDSLVDYVGCQANFATGSYVTGLLDMYTEPGTGNIDITLDKDINLDERDSNLIYLDNITASNLDLILPESGAYDDITVVDENSISIYNLFLMPNSGTQTGSTSNRTGSCVVNVDKNHGYVEEVTSIINRVPVQFDSVITTLNGRNTTNNLRPKDYSFDVISITGNKILVDDSKNYFLKENGRPDYYDQDIKGNYITNGIGFSGSFFYNHKNIYDVRRDLNSFMDIHKNVKFDYTHDTRNFVFVMDSGAIKSFDNVTVTFPTGYDFGDDKFSSLVEDINIGSRTGLKDLEPFKDSLLLETSSSIESTDTSESIMVTGKLSIDKSTQGSCVINNNLTNRLHSGLVLNHANGDANGHTISEIVSGLVFSGVVPKDTNVLSTNITGFIDDNHIGHASVFATGTYFSTGTRILREAIETDVGYGEYYLINTNISNLAPTGLSGVGIDTSTYKRHISTHRTQDSLYLEFVYLGQNDNEIKIVGDVKVSGINTSGLKIYRSSFGDQTRVWRDSLGTANTISNSGYKLYSSFLGAGDDEDPSTDTIDVTITGVKRFDKIKITLDPPRRFGIDFSDDRNFFDFQTYVVSGVDIKPYILESSDTLNTNRDYYPYINPEEPSFVYTPNPTIDANSCVDCDTLIPQYIPALDPEYSSLEKNDYYILPYIKTNDNYCGDTYRKNEQLFFNGNFIKIQDLETIKSFIQTDDEFSIVKFNDTVLAKSGVAVHLSNYSDVSDQRIVSGIVIDGEKDIPALPAESGYELLREQENRFNLPLGVSYNELLPSQGTVNFIKTLSGELTVYDYNNLYYHTYGGTTSHYPLDLDGKEVLPAQTGRYSIIHDASTCTSGTLCVTITGYNVSTFANVNAGKTMFFDFDDGASSLTNSYSITDLLSPNALSINPAYDSTLINKSGIVYIIDSRQNIKASNNPNLDNSLVVSSGTMGGLSSVNTKILNYYDNDSKRWKHTVHVLGEQPAYTGYNISLSSKNTNFYSINPNKLSISGIQYSFGDLNDFNDLSNPLVIPDNISQVFFKVTTLEGDQSLFDNRRHSAPKVSMSGIGVYQLEWNEPGYFGWHGSGWNLGVKWNPPKDFHTNRDVLLRLSDLTGDVDYPFTISQRQIPEINTFYATGYVGSGSTWQMGFDFTKLDIDSGLASNDLSIQITNTPTSTYYRFYEDDRSVVYSGTTVGANTGIHNIELTIQDISTTPYVTLGVMTGVLNILDHISNRPEFVVEANNLPTTYYVNLDTQPNMVFDIPAELGPEPSQVIDSLSLTFNTSETYNLTLSSSSYDYDTDRFRIVMVPKTTGTPSVYQNFSDKFVNQSVSISLKQPVYDSIGNYTYNTYSNNVGFNVIFYRPMLIEPIPLNTTLEFDVNEPWSMEFYVASGVTEHDAGNKPNANIFHAPNLGTYDTDIPQYSLTYEYDSTLKKWKVAAVSKKDGLGRFIHSTGTYPITIFAEDDYSSRAFNYNYSVKYDPIITMDNISADVYTTPNNKFFTKADSKDVNENQSNQISFPGSLKEPSISIANTVRKYDRDLKLWTNSYTSNPMTDKYDARVNVAGSTITVQAKGIGKDKIISMAKLHTMEIESNELAGIPLTITGIAGWNPAPDGAIDVDQGDDAWELEFKTIGGLAHASYPPTILLTDMPTFCTGYNPLVETQLQCLVEPPQWNANDQGGSWSYHFSGLPSCILLGRKEFTITAIDTDTSLLPDSPYLPDTDDVAFAFNYIEGTFNGNDPVIKEDSNYADMDKILPNCGTSYIKKLDFGPGDSALCIGPTGIKTISVSGDVPAGLSYSLYFPETANTPVSPYSNLGSGYLRIEGNVTTFASGGSYDEELHLTITDGRDLTASQTITFTDSSTPIDPDIAAAVFFDSPTPVLTPKSGLKPLRGASPGYQPPAISDALVCRSVLPHNECANEQVVFSGLTASNDLRIYLHETDTIGSNDVIYIEFDSDNADNNGTYRTSTDSTGLHITGVVSLQNPLQTPPITGFANGLKEEKDNIQLTDVSSLFGQDRNIKDSTTKCILGAGRFAADESTAGGAGTDVGLLGLLIPSHSGTTQSNIGFANSDDYLESLTLSRVNTAVDIISTTSWHDCYQTGNLYMSGLVLPPIHAEIVDPPPAQDYFFSFNGVRFALSTRLAYGANDTERLILANQRTASLKYDVIDVVSGVSIQNGSVSAGSSFDTNILSRESGTVYKIKITKDAGDFPSYNPGETPAAENEYVWPHKGDNLLTVPTQNTFPPLTTVGFDKISVVNSLTDSDPNGIVMDPLGGLAIGGYIPDDAGIGNSIPYNWSGNTVVSGVWTTENFLPRMTGIMQKNLLKDPVTSGGGSYAASTTTLSITGISPVVNDFLLLKAYAQGTLIYNNSLTVAAENINGDSLVISTDLGIGNQTVSATVDYKCSVEDVDLVNNELVLKDNFDYTVGDSIGVDLNSFISTELNLLEENGYVSVVSGANDLVYLGNTNSSTGWLKGFVSGNLVSVYQNIYDNIKIMPQNITFISEGKFSFLVTGRSNTREDEDLIYKIGTMDNPDMPVFDTVTYPTVNIFPKKYFQNYTLHVNKPISIVTSSVQKVGNTLSFSVSGGQRPVPDNIIDVQLAAGIGGDYGYCGFWRETVGTGIYIEDAYDSTDGLRDVSISLDPKYGTDWSVHNTVKIRVEDNTGIDTYTYTFT